MITAKQLAALIEDFAPAELAEEWDNSGLLYDSGRAIERVLVALDATSAVYEEAAALGCEAVVAHHPIVFDAIKQMDHTHPLAKAAENRISVIAAHTNFDAAAGGVNDVLAELIGIRRPEPFGVGRAGEIEPISAAEFAALVKRRLGRPALSCTPGPERIERVAVVGGSGGGFVAKAAEAGCSALLTGEARHHEALLARDLGLLLVVAGHYATEHPAVAALGAKLGERLGARASCTVAKTERDPFEII